MLKAVSSRQWIRPFATLPSRCCFPPLRPALHRTDDDVLRLKSRWHSTKLVSHYNVKETLNERTYQEAADATLDTLTETLEAAVEDSSRQLHGWDVEYSSGVLTIKVGELGTYVINKQPPNRQIWLSSPFSGPKRYDYDDDAEVWFYVRDGSRMSDLLRRELSDASGSQDLKLDFAEGDSEGM